MTGSLICGLLPFDSLRDYSQFLRLIQSLKYLEVVLLNLSIYLPSVIFYGLVNK